MSAVILIIYLVGAICTVWSLDVSIMNREERPILSMASSSALLP